MDNHGDQAPRQLVQLHAVSQDDAVAAELVHQRGQSCDRRADDAVHRRHFLRRRTALIRRDTSGPDVARAYVVQRRVVVEQCDYTVRVRAVIFTARAVQAETQAEARVDGKTLDRECSQSDIFRYHARREGNFNTFRSGLFLGNLKGQMRGANGIIKREHAERLLKIALCVKFIFALKCAKIR